MAQVRLDADVEALLRARADDDGVSLAHAANRALRAALSDDTAPEAPDAPEAGSASLSRPQRRVDRRWQRPAS